MVWFVASLVVGQCSQSVAVSLMLPVHYQFLCFKGVFKSLSLCSRIFTVLPCLWIFVSYFFSEGEV